MIKENDKLKSKMRYPLLDTLRGIVILSMICYHGAWNLVYIYGIDWLWYKSTGAYVWQQSICWTFILLSGFCFSLGKRHLRSGLLVSGGGALVTLVTVLVMPENRVVFGVLTCIGSCILFMIPLDKLPIRVQPALGAALSFACFLLTKHINSGYLGFFGIRLSELPKDLYHNLFTTYLGFPERGFYSTDYFSLMPWFFLFLTGYFVHKICRDAKVLNTPIFQFRIPGIEFLGRHSLLIYMLHQPLLVLIFEILF